MTQVFTFFNSLVAPATGSELDINFNILGSMAVTPCVAVGTNSIVLTQQTNTPVFSSYVNYAQAGFVASTTNTSSPVTLQVGSLPALQVYKDTLSGPVLVEVGDIVSGGFCFVTYDSALNSGAGGWHLTTAHVPTTGGFAALSGATFTGPVFGTTITASTAFRGTSISVTGGVFASTASIGALTTTSISTSVLTATTGATLSNVTVGAGGSTITNVFSTLSSQSSVVITNGSVSAISVLLAGCSVGDIVNVSPPSGVPTNVLCTHGRVDSGGTVVFRLYNTTQTVGSSTVPAGSYRCCAMRVIP